MEWNRTNLNHDKSDLDLPPPAKNKTNDNKTRVIQPFTDRTKTTTSSLDSVVGGAGSTLRRVPHRLVEEALRYQRHGPLHGFSEVVGVRVYLRLRLHGAAELLPELPAALILFFRF